MKDVKKITVLIIGLLLTTSIVSVNAFDKGELTGSSRSSDPPYADIYVDDDNTEGPWNGTLEYPYQHIEDGVNAADPGDIIFVFNGNYSESIVVEKPLKLIGEDKYNTILHNNDFQVFKVDGFELCNFCFTGSDPIIFMGRCSNSTISGNFITNAYNGIILSNSSNCLVSNNIIHSNSKGITLRADANNNKITNNYIHGGGSADRGIFCYTYSNDNVVANNTISNFNIGIEADSSNWACIIDNIIMNSRHWGINLCYVSNLTVSRNKIINVSGGYPGTFDAIGMSSVYDTLVFDNIIKNVDGIGIKVSYSCRNVVSGNIIDNATDSGIHVSMSGSNGFFDYDDNVFTNNTITNISGNDYGLGYGIFVVLVKNITLQYNNINNCDIGILISTGHPTGVLGKSVICKNNVISYNDYGVFLSGYTYFNVVAKNEIRNNGFGVVLSSIEQVGASQPFENWIVANNISENIHYGVYADSLTISNNIYYNNFIDNGQNANDKGTNTWHKSKITGSLGNYWSDYDGEDNQWPGGIGDTPYNIPPWPFRNKDRYPSMTPIDIDNINVNEFVINELTQESSQTIQQPESQESTATNPASAENQLESQPSSQQTTMLQQIKQLIQNIIYNIKLRYQTTNI